METKSENISKLSNGELEDLILELKCESDISHHLEYIKRCGGLSRLMGVKKICTGWAKFPEDSKWRYRGMTLPILGVYMIHKGDDFFPEGSKSYLISLLGVPDMDSQLATDIHEKYIELIDVREVDESTILNG